MILSGKDIYNGKDEKTSENEESEREIVRKIIHVRVNYS